MSYLVIALHGHLPYINHPEHELFLEEDWLFEGLADCYLPILAMLDGWRSDGVKAQITLGLSPPLLSMMANHKLRERAARYLEARRSLTARYLGTIAHDNEFRRAAEFSRDETERAIGRYEGCGRDVARAFGEHHQQGRVEIMTCNATHGLVPVLQDLDVARAQVREAVRVHERFLGFRPRGIWMPECGIHPAGLQACAEENLCFTFSEDRAVRFAWPPPQHDVYRPLWSPEGVGIFPRDPGSAKEVWSAAEGYPGDFRYREFYRDLGYDADLTLLDAVHKQGTGAKKNVGVKLHRITGRVPLDEKQPYDPRAALEAVQQHATHFAQRRTEDAAEIERTLGISPLITSAFDCELFGHWWHEGPWFLDAFLRKLAVGDGPHPVSAYHYLELEPTQQVSFPAVSSWGDGGAFEVWVNQKNDWLWRRVHDAQQRYTDVVRNTGVDAGLRGRAIKQACRELLLAQSSDWPFILTMGTQMGYAQKRPVVHLSRCHRLLSAVESGHIDAHDLEQIEQRDEVFPDVDPRTMLGW
ncbi:MAG TPA: 1,4-alpha-glucan branching protein domain-containing protein [Myxococcota bacterium]